MLNRVLQDIGHRLAKKPFGWMSWWWGHRWGDFISVDPPLTEDTPLWQRDEGSLKSVQLFGLRPDELQAKIVSFWQQPFWKRWLLGLFTSINSQIKLWSYYQRCLSFREVYKENSFIEKELIAFTPEQDIFRELTHWLNKDFFQFENYLEKRSGNFRWIKNFNTLQIKSERKRWLSFLKLLEKKLTRLSIESDRNRVRNQLKQEYINLEDALYQYLCTWHNNTYNLLSSNDGETLNISTSDENYINAFEKEINCSIYSIEDWVKMKRQLIASMLQEESPKQFIRIKHLLESSLSTFKSLIDTHLKNYLKLIVEVRWGRLDGDKAIQQVEILQTELIHFFRKSALLFHPDKSFGNEALRKILTEQFQQFQQISEKSMEIIKNDLQTLQNYLSKQRNIQGFWKMAQDLDLNINKRAQDMEEIKIKMDAAFRKYKADLEAQSQQFKTDLETLRQELKGGTEATFQRFNAETKVKLQQFNAETEAMRQAMHRKIDELETENNQNLTLIL